MSRCSHATDRPRSWRWVAAVLALIACGDETEPPRQPPADRGVAYEAASPTLPDFRDYVVGELPAPAADSRDPFRDGVGAPDPPKRVSDPPPARPLDFQLNGIVERGGERVALFRRHSVRVGESIAGWTVREIGPRYVVLERGGRTRRLSL